MPSSRVGIAALAIALGCSSCLSVNWQRASRAEGIPVAWAELVIGESDLALALERLGAPLYVYEHQTHGAAMVWGRSVLEEKGFNISIPVAESASASFDYGEENSALRGVMLLFDSEWRLSQIREGLLRDLTAGRAVRPAVPTMQPAEVSEENRP